MTKYQIAMKQIPKRYRGMLQRACIEADAVAASRAYDKGYAAGKLDANKSKESLRVDLSMSIQRLAESNAQIATSLSRALDKLV